MNRRHFVVSASASIALLGHRALAQEGDILTSELTGAQVDLADSGLVVSQQHIDSADGSEHIHFEIPQIMADLYFWPPENQPAAEFLEGLVGMSASLFPGFELVASEAVDGGGYIVFTDEGSIGYYEYQLDAYGEFDLLVLLQTSNDLFLDMFTRMQKVQLDGFPPMLYTEEAGIEAIATARLEESATANESDTSGTAAGTSRSTRSSRTSATDDDDDAGESTTSRSSRSASTDDKEDDTGATNSRSSRSASTDDDEDTGTTTSRSSRSASTDDEDENDTGTTNSRSSRSSRSSEEPDDDDTGTTNSRTSGGDPVQAVQDHRDEFLTSYSEFLVDLEGAADETLSSAEQDAHWAALVDHAAAWQEYPAVAAAIEFPAEMVDLETAYLDWADGVAELGATFDQLSLGTAEVEDFLDAYDAWTVLDDDLLDVLSTLGVRGGTRARARQPRASSLRRPANIRQG